MPTNVVGISPPRTNVGTEDGGGMGGVTGRGAKAEGSNFRTMWSMGGAKTEGSKVTIIMASMR
jgi:hypothetical protein